MQKIFTVGEVLGPTTFCTRPLPTFAFLHAGEMLPSRFACEYVQVLNNSGYVMSPSEPIAYCSIGVPRTVGSSLSTWKSNLSWIGVGLLFEPLPPGLVLPSTV